MANAGVYDQILRKDEFTKVLREKGLSDEKIKDFWTKFEFAFWTAFMDNAFRALPKEKQEELAKDLKIDGVNDMLPLYKKVEAYIATNPKAIDSLTIAGTSAKQVYESVTNLLTTILEGGRNGK